LIVDIFIAWIPFLLLISFWFISGMYYNKKIENHKSKVVVDNTRPKSCLTLMRGIEATNYLRNYKIFIDDLEYEGIESGETKHIELPPGSHTLLLKIDWCKSKEYEFKITTLENTELTCGASYLGWKCAFMCFIKPSNWLYVKVT